MNVVLKIKVRELDSQLSLLSGCHEGLVTQCEVQSLRNSEGALQSRAGPSAGQRQNFIPACNSVNGRTTADELSCHDLPRPACLQFSTGTARALMAVLDFTVQSSRSQIALLCGMHVGHIDDE